MMRRKSLDLERFETGNEEERRLPPGVRRLYLLLANLPFSAGRKQRKRRKRDAPRERIIGRAAMPEPVKCVTGESHQESSSCRASRCRTNSPVGIRPPTSEPTIFYRLLFIQEQFCLPLAAFGCERNTNDEIQRSSLPISCTHFFDHVRFVCASRFGVRSRSEDDPHTRRITTKRITKPRAEIPNRKPFSSALAHND